VFSEKGEARAEEMKKKIQRNREPGLDPSPPGKVRHTRGNLSTKKGKIDISPMSKKQLERRERIVEVLLDEGKGAEGKPDPFRARKSPEEGAHKQWQPHKA